MLVHVMNPKYCPVQLVQELFRKVRETKQAYTKHVVRLVPMQHIAFPRDGEMQEALARLVRRQFSEYAAHYPNIYDPSNFKKTLPKFGASGASKTASSSEGGGNAAVSVADADAPLEDDDDESSAKRPRLSSEDPTCVDESSAKRPRLSSEDPTCVDAKQSGGPKDGEEVVQEAKVEQEKEEEAAAVAPLFAAPETPYQHSGQTSVYSIYFKARSCNSLTKKEAHQACTALMPKDGVSRYDYRAPKVCGTGFSVRLLCAMLFSHFVLLVIGCGVV